jgi:hypothetical protein
MSRRSPNHRPTIVRKGVALLAVGLGSLTFAACGSSSSSSSASQHAKTKTWDIATVCPPKDEPIADVGREATADTELDFDGWADINIGCVQEGSTILHPLTIYEDGKITQKPGLNIGTVVITASLRDGEAPDISFEGGTLTGPTGHDAPVSQVEINGVYALQSVAVK